MLSQSHARVLLVKPTVVSGDLEIWNPPPFATDFSLKGRERAFQRRAGSPLQGEAVSLRQSGLLDGRAMVAEAKTFSMFVVVSVQSWSRVAHGCGVVRAQPEWLCYQNVRFRSVLGLGRPCVWVVRAQPEMAVPPKRSTA